MTDALVANDLPATACLGFGDEMQLSLHGTLSRVLAPRGIAVRQPVQGERESIYLSLCVAGESGVLTWHWIPCMHHQAIAWSVQAWRAAGIAAVVWDNASSHRHAAVAAVGLPLINLPPYAPELNPAERIFQELRKAVKGKTFPRLEEKMLLVENTLRHWQRDPACVRRLCGWDWIHEARQAVTGKEKQVA